ncbi:histidinol-phosphate transaminase [Candidatus Peregrinibacteria bacterium]|nr:histidinol-phosphate transaminase [Candidatus Peregrinibacteria bacterium]
MKNFALSQIQQMKPYLPPLEGRINYEGMLLDFNERTIPPSPKVFEAIQEFLKTGKLNLYPEYFDFCEQVAEYAEVDPSEVMVTNGSDHGIELIFRTFTEKGDEVIVPSPSFAMFYQISGVTGNKIIMPQYLKKDLSYPLEEVLASITPNTKLIIVCNPNNPTGTLVPLPDIEKILQKAKNSIILVDEAYYEFSQVTAVSFLKKYPNLIVTRTFSKAFGLVALRIGYVISNAQNIQEMMKVRGPYDVNSLAYYAVKAALQDIQNLNSYVDEVMNESKPFVENFFQKNEIRFYKSGSNFILFESPTSDFAQKLEENGIRIRPQTQKGIEGFLRVSIGTMKEIERFCDVFSQLL